MLSVQMLNVQISWNVGCETAKQQVKKAEQKEGIQIYLGFSIKMLFVFT